MVAIKDRFMITLDEFFEFIQSCVSELNDNKNVISKFDINIINIVKTAINKKDKDEILLTFINNTYPYWDQIQQKKDDFFVTNSNDIFGEYVTFKEFNVLKLVFTNGVLDKEIKDIMWTYLNALIKISIKHICSQRELTIEKNSSGSKKLLTKKPYLPNISIAKEIKRWNLKEQDLIE